MHARRTGSRSLIASATAGLLLAAAPAASAQTGTVDVRIGTANIALAGGNVPAVLVDARSVARAAFTITADSTSVAVTHVRGVNVVTPGAGCTRTAELTRTTVTCDAAGLRGISVTGGPDNDRIDATAVNSPNLHLVMAGGTGGDDLRSGTPSTTKLDGGPGNDILRAGPSGRTDMVGGTGSDQLRGGPGFDVMVGGAGSDLIDGGPGNDNAQYDNDDVDRAAGVTVTLGDDLCNDGSAGDVAIDGAVAPGCTANGADRDRIVNVEGVGGSSGPDDVTGSEAAESLVGGGGGDRIEGGGGPDRLLGDLGVDLLLARDGLIDTTVACGRAAERVEGDRAVADPEDIVHPSCTTVERGGGGVGGPIGSPNGIAGSPPGSPPTPPGATPPPVEIDIPETTLLPAQPPGLPVTPDVPPTGAEGAGAGGGDNGRTAPQLQITSPAATVDRRGRVALRVRCVYRAKACTGTVTVTSARTVKVRRKGGTLRLPEGAVMGRATLSIPWGRSAPVRLALRNPARAILRSGQLSLRARAEVRARDSAAPNGREARVRRNVVIGGR